MACDRLVFRRYINFLLCLYIDLWTLKNFVIINSNTSFVLILFFFIDFFFSVHSKNVILLSNLLLSDISNMSSFLLLLYQWIHRCFLFLFDISRKKKKKKRVTRVLEFYMSSGTIYHGISRFALPYLVRNVT